MVTSGYRTVISDQLIDIVQSLADGKAHRLLTGDHPHEKLSLYGYDLPMARRQ